MTYRLLTAVVASIAVAGCDGARNPVNPSAVDSEAIFEDNDSRTSAEGLMITSGTWSVALGGPPFQFNLQGVNFSAIGSWESQAKGTLCFAQCTAGQRMSLDFTFLNEFPSGIDVFAPGTLNGAFVEFGGRLHFDAKDIEIPFPTPEQALQPLQIRTRFRFFGTLKAWDVLNRRDPLLVFKQFVAADGIATLELLAGPVGSTQLTFLRLTYDFAAAP
jgi:hypothetical protein